MDLNPFLSLARRLIVFGAISAAVQFLAVAGNDPVRMNRADSALTATGIAVRQYTTPRGLMAWELMKEAELLSVPQLRTLALDLLRMRRFSHAVSPADLLVVEAWAGRDLAGATQALMQITDWEESQSGLGDWDSDIDFCGATLWLRLVVDHPYQAMELAGQLKGREAVEAFFGFVDRQVILDIAPFREWANLSARHFPEARQKEIIFQAMDTLGQLQGVAAVKAALDHVPDGRVRTAALLELERNKEKWEKSIGSVRRMMKEPDLVLLERFEPRQMGVFVWPSRLYQKVRQMPAAEALRLGKMLTNDQPTGHWLGWMLGMQASETEPSGAYQLRFPKPDNAPPPWFRPRWPDPGITYALLARNPETPKHLRGMLEGSDRTQALTGYFSRMDLAEMDDWVIQAKKWNEPTRVFLPLIARLAASGDSAMALELALSIEWKSGDENASEDPVAVAAEVIALHDFPAALRQLMARDPGPEDRRLARGLSRAIGYQQAAEILPLLVPAVRERFEDLLPEPWWPWIAVEDAAALAAWIQTSPDFGWVQDARDYLKYLKAITPGD